jgi:peptidoglycan/LPS O-acetylase OafA/YrhL
MRSSSGDYYPRLDHVRAFAAFLVFYWHCAHMAMPTSAVPSFFAGSLFEEGWTGVALFMTLSGYLFAKIVDKKEINYWLFTFNRFIRLAPLLGIVFFYYFYTNSTSLQKIASGLYYSRDWPGPTWSLSVEMHFYAIFPLLLILQRRFGVVGLASVLLAAIGLRFCLWFIRGEVQSLAYWTIIGNIDEFILGMIFFHMSRSSFLTKYSLWIFSATLISLMLFWHVLNTQGGFYDLGRAGYPSPSALWCILPTIQGVAWGVLIVTYEHLPFTMPRFLDYHLARAGEASYSIYLWHAIVLEQIPKVVSVAFPKDVLLASIITCVLFVPMVLLARLSFEVIERPFLRYRTRYTTQTRVVPP